MNEKIELEDNEAKKGPSVIITGAKGQLGLDLVEEFQRRGYQVHGYGREELDITDILACTAVVKSVDPEIIVHAAAYTAVDDAEANADEAYRVNAYGTRNIAVAAAEAGAKLVAISTDYVFNGTASEPYDEFHPADPVNVYGRSKWAGEEMVRQVHSSHFIVRTSWVYGLHGSNFVKTMLKLGGSQPAVQVVSDQIGSPTYTRDLAEVIAELASTDKYGTYHVTGGGSCSWYDFASAIFELAGLNAKAVPVATSAFPRPAPRPAYSVLDNRALHLNGFKEMRPWAEALRNFLEKELAFKEDFGRKS